MTDLFGNGKHGGRPGRTPPPAPNSAQPDEQTPPEPRAVFGTPSWDRCRCGKSATLHFPKAGGIRLCLRCAEAQGRWTPSPPTWSRAPAAQKD